MSRLLYFDCFSGISGDMTLGALLDAGAPLAEIEAQLRRLPVSGWTIAAEKVKRRGIAATHVRVTCAEQHPHRGLTEILRVIDAANFAPRVTQRARTIFECLGEAEARIHSTTVDKVHFHEVGAVDAIVDIVGAAIGFDLLDVEEFACSPVNVGGGTVQSAHGLLPVPAPATADMLRAAPTFSSGVQRELTTPTGAAILAGTSVRYGAQPPMTVRKIGYGAGTADFKEQANVLRVFLGDSLEAAAAQKIGAAPPGAESVCVVETNLDDMSPQLYGHLVERALAAGALDIFSVPAQMKKNRPGQLITVLCEAARLDEIVALLFRETTTLGVRVGEMRRRCLEREVVPVVTKYGTVRMKLGRDTSGVLNAAPEFDDCRRLAEEHGVPLKEVIAEAAYTYRKGAGGGGK